MDKDDFPFAVALTNQMDWGLSEQDFEFSMELEPEGCFMLLDGRERIGFATNVSFGKIGWFGNLVVEKNRRNRGAGSALVNHSLEYLKRTGAGTVGLYAYEERIPFYDRLGFRSDSDFLVLKGNAVASNSEMVLKQATLSDVKAIVDFDRSCFGASRRKLLEPILLDSDNICYVVDEDKEIAGYAVAKVYRGMAELGPLLCREGREQFAVELLKTVLNRPLHWRGMRLFG
jgi:GNAT superfamily N-acetyltransferase